MNFKFFLLVLSLEVLRGTGQTVNVADQTYFESIGFHGPKPQFRRQLYKASTHNDVLVQIEGESIVLENCGSIVATLKLILDERKYLPFLPPPPAYPSIGNCSVLISPLILKRGVADGVADDFMDLVVLRAVYQNYVIAETSIVVTSETYSDPFTFNYSSNGTAYIILNYFYFKIFLSLIFLTGLAILLIEVREIYLKCRDRTYSELHNTINYI